MQEPLEEMRSLGAEIVSCAADAAKEVNQIQMPDC